MAPTSIMKYVYFMRLMILITQFCLSFVCCSVDYFRQGASNAYTIFQSSSSSALQILYPQYYATPYALPFSTFTMQL